MSIDRGILTLASGLLLQIYQMRQIARFLAIPAHNLVVGDLTVAMGENDNLDIVAEGAEAIPAAK